MPALATAPAARMAAGALLDWWRLAGHTMLVADSARPWLVKAPPAEATATPQAAARPMPAPAPAAVAPRGDAMAGDVLAGITTHAALRAHMAEVAPNAPFLDGEGRRGLMILGEGPSAEDLRSGRPFSGPAGQLLDRMLAAIGLSRADVFITLLAPRKRTPGPPLPNDIAADLPLTLRHIALADVSRLLLLGAIPTQVLAQVDAPISRVRGQRLDVAACGRVLPALATFNPAYLLRQPAQKALAWRDLLQLSQWLDS